MGRPVIRHGRHRGFTLVELIVATTLTVLVTGSTAALLRSTAAARRLADRQMRLQQEARLAVAAIATALHNAYRSGGDQAPLEGIDGWFGEMPADRLRFFTLSRCIVRRNQPESDVRECEFFLSEPTDQTPPALMQRIDPTRNAPPDGGGVLLRLAGNVLGMDLAYHDGMQWLDEWPETRKGWPLAVRVRLAVLAEDKSAKVWTAARIVNFPRRPKPQGSKTADDSATASS